MPGANPPRVPEGLRDMMKSLTKEVLREKPSNIFEFSAHYFETMLHDGRDSPVRNYEPQESYDTIMKNRVKHQVPLSLVYSVVPDSLTDLIKEFIKAVLRQKPKNICEFAVEYFRQQQIMKEMQSTTSIDYTSYENYFQKKDRYSYTSYVKCSCGRLLGNAAYESNYLNIKKTKLRQSSKTSKSSVDETSSMCKIEHEHSEEMSNMAADVKTENDRGIKYLTAVYVIQRHFRLYLARKRETKTIISKKVMVPPSSSLSLQAAKQSKERENLSMETAALILQKAYRKFLKNNRLRNQKRLQEAALNSNEISPQANMSMETAALIIQKAFHKFSNKRLHNNKLTKTTKMSKLETSNTECEGDESTDNMSETASYTSASTALLSTESVGEHFDLSGGNEEGVLHQTIQEDEEVENDNQNTRTMSNTKKYQNLNKDKYGITSDIKGSADVSKLSTNNEKEIKLQTSETENYDGLNELKGKNIEVIKIVNDSLRTIIDGIELDTSHKDISENDINSILNEKNNLIKNVNEDAANIRKMESGSENSENQSKNIEETTKEITEGSADGMKSESLNKIHSDILNSLDDDIGKSIKIKTVIEGEEVNEITFDNTENNHVETIFSKRDTNENQDNENSSQVSIKGNSIDLDTTSESKTLHETDGSDSKTSNDSSSKEVVKIDPIKTIDNLESLSEKMISSEISAEESQKTKPMNSKSFSQQESVDKLKSDTKSAEKKEISKDALKAINLSDTILKSSESAQLLLDNQNVQLSDVKSLDDENDDSKDNRNKDPLKEELTQGNSTSESIGNNQTLKETTQMFINCEQNNEVLKEKPKPMEDTGTSETEKRINTILQSSDHVDEATSNTFLNDQRKGEEIQESELEVVDSIDKQIVSESQITDSKVAGNKVNEDKNKLKEDRSFPQEMSTSDKNSEILQSQDDKTKSTKSKAKVVDSQENESIEKQIASESQKSDDTVAVSKENEGMNKVEEVNTSVQNLSEQKIETFSESSEDLQPRDVKDGEEDKTKLQDLSTTSSDKTVNEQILRRERRALNETRLDISDSAEGASNLNIPENDDSKIRVASNDKVKDASEETSSLIKLDNDDSEIKVESENKRKDSSEGTNSLNKSENDVNKITDESDDKGKDSSMGKSPDNDNFKTTVESTEEVKLTNQTTDPEKISTNKSKADETISREDSLKNRDLSKTNVNEENHSSQEKSENDESTYVVSDTEPHSLENLHKSKANTKDNSFDSNAREEPSSQIEDNTEEKLKEDNDHKTNLSISSVKDRNKEEASTCPENTNPTNMEANTQPQQKDTTKENSQDNKTETTSQEKPEKTEKASLKTTSSDSNVNEHATDMLTPKSSVDGTQNLISKSSDTENIENILEHGKQESLSNEQKGEDFQPSNESLRESLSLHSQDNLDSNILKEELMQETTSATMDELKSERKSSAKTSQEPNVAISHSVQSNKSLENIISKEDDKKEDTILSKQILEKEEELPQSRTTSDMTKQSDEYIPHTDSTNVQSILESSEIGNTNADEKSHENREISKETSIQKIDLTDSSLKEQNVGVTSEKSTNNEPLIDHVQTETLTEVKDVKDLVPVDNLEMNNKSREFNESEQDLTEAVSNKQTVKALTHISESSDQSVEIIKNTNLTAVESDTNVKETKENDIQKTATSSSTMQETSQPETIVLSTELETTSQATLLNENSNKHQDLIVDQQSAEESENSKEVVEDPLHGKQPNVQQSLNKSIPVSSDNKNEANEKSPEDGELRESNERSEPPRSESIRATEEKSEINNSELENKSDSLDKNNKDNDDIISKEDNSQKSGSVEHVVSKSNSVDDIERTEGMSSKVGNSQKSESVEHEIATKSNSVDDVDRTKDMSSKVGKSQKIGSGEHEDSMKSKSVDDVERTKDMSSKKDNFKKSEHEDSTKSKSVDDVERTEDMNSNEDNSQESGSGKHEVATKSNSVEDVNRTQDMISKEDNSQKSGSGELEVGLKTDSVDDVEGTDSNGSSKNRPVKGASEKLKDKNLRGSKHKVDDLSSSQIDDNKTIGTSKLSESSNNKLTHASMLPNSKKLHSSNQKEKKVDYSSGRLIPVPIAELQLKSFKTPANAGPWYEVHVEKPKEEEKNLNVDSEVYRNTEQSINKQWREEEKNSNAINEEDQNDEESIFGNEYIDNRSETSSYESNKSTLELLYAYHLNNELRYNSEISEIDRLIGLMQAADQDVSYLKDPLDYTNFSKEEERTSPINNKSSISFFVPFDNQDNESVKSKKHTKQNIEKLDIKGNNEVQSTTSKEILSQSMIEDSLDEIMEMEDIIITETLPGKSLLQTIPEQNENESPSPQRSLDSKSILVINESETSENKLEYSSKPIESPFESNALDTPDEDGSNLKEKSSQNLATEPNLSTHNPRATLIDDTEHAKSNELESARDIKIEAESDKETHDITKEPTNSQLSIEAKPTDLDATSGPRSVDSSSDNGAEKHVGMYEKVHHEIANIVKKINSALEGDDKTDLSMEEIDNIKPAKLQDTPSQSENKNIEKGDENDELKESGYTDENEPQEATLPEVTYSEDEKKDDAVHGKEDHGIATSDLSEQNLKAALPEHIISEASLEKTENVKPEDKMSEKGDENEENKIQEKDSHDITTLAINEQNLKPALLGPIKTEISKEEPVNEKPVDLEDIRRPQSIDKMSTKGDETEKLKEDGEKDSEMHDIVTSDINERILSSSMPRASNSKPSMDETGNVKTGNLEDTKSENKMNEKDNESKELKEIGEKDDGMDGMDKEDVHEIVTSVLNVLNLNSALVGANNSELSIGETENTKPDLESTRIPRSLDKMCEKIDGNEEFKEGGEIYDKTHEKDANQLVSESLMDQAENTKGPEGKINEENIGIENATFNKVSGKDDEMHEEEPHISDINIQNLNLTNNTNSDPLMEETEETDTHEVNKMSENGDENEEFKEDGKKDIRKQKEKLQEITTSELHLALANDSISEHSMEDMENVKPANLEDAHGSQSPYKINEEENESKELKQEEEKYDVLTEVPQEIITTELIETNVKEELLENINYKLSMEKPSDLEDTHEQQLVNILNEKDNIIEEFMEGNDKKSENESNEIATSDINEQNFNSALPEAPLPGVKFSMDEVKNIRPTGLDEIRVSKSLDKMGEKGEENEEFMKGGETAAEIYEQEANEIATSLPGANNSDHSLEEPVGSPEKSEPTNSKSTIENTENANSVDLKDIRRPQSVDKNAMNKIAYEQDDKLLKNELELKKLRSTNSDSLIEEIDNGNSTDLEATLGPIDKMNIENKGKENIASNEVIEKKEGMHEEETFESTTFDKQNLNSAISGVTKEPKNVKPTDLENTDGPPSVDKMSEKGEVNEEFMESGELNKEMLEKETHEIASYDLKEQNVKAEQCETTNSKSSLEKTENANSIVLDDMHRPQSVDKKEADKIGIEQDDKMLKNDLRSTNAVSLSEETDNEKLTTLDATQEPIDKTIVENESNKNIASNEVVDKNEGMREEETFEITTSVLDEQNKQSGATYSESLMEESENVKLTEMESDSTRVTSSVDKLSDENELSKEESPKSKNTELETRSNGEFEEGDNKNQQNEADHELSGKTNVDSESYDSIKENDTTINNVPLNLKIAQENDLQQNHETKLADKVGSMGDMAGRIAAAIVIQRAFRRFLKGKNNKNTIADSKKLKEISENEAALVIQKAFRQYIFNISHKKQSETNLESSDMESFEHTKENDNKSENSSIETSPSGSQITQIYKMNRSESQISTDTIENLSNVDYLDGSDNKLDSPKSKWFVGNEPIESSKDAPNLISVDSPSLSIIDTNSSDSEKLLVIADTEPQLVACLNNVDDSNLKSNLSIGNNIIGEENGESVEGTNENSKNNDLAGLNEDETQTTEAGNKEDNNAMIQNDDIKFDEAVPAFDENINEENLVEVIEKPCIKKTVSQSNLNEIESEGNEVTESKKDRKSVETPESEAETDVILKTIETDSLDAATEKLSKADEVIEKMFSRRLSETKSTPSLSEMSFKEASFDEPVIRPMSALHENISIDLEETDSIVVLNRLQREETRESSAQSDAIVFGENNLETDDIEALENIEVSTTRIKRMYTIAGDDTSTIFKSVTIDETIKYIDPPNSSTSATSGSSFCLDDDISENIRQKMMAYSLSEADSDYFEGNNDGPDSSVDRSAVRNDDFNISTALADTTGTSTETESTIVSAATKIQAGARGFLTRRRLRRLSGGTTTSNQETKASFGNEAISESLERFIEDEAAKKIQFAYRNHYYKKGKVNDDDEDDDDEGASLDNSSLAARRLTLQRGDALRNDSTPDEDHNDNGNITKLNISSSTKRSKPLGDYSLKPWTAMRQNSMPVQIDTNIFRVIPKQLSKRIKSAENEKKTRRITSFKKK